MHTKGTQTSKGERMAFGTWLDMEGHWIDSVHFPKTVTSSPFQGPGCYIIKGIVTKEFGFISITAQHITRLNYQNLDQPSANTHISGKRSNKRLQSA